MKKVLVTVVALGAGLTLGLPGALARPHAGTTTQAVPGITSRAITIGGTFPFSGPVSSYAPIEAGMQTYFKYVNARRGPDGKRGVYGRGIIFKTYDDGYNPAQAIQLHNKLVLQDKVFAVVGTLGTENNRAIQPMLNQRKVPQILVSTGASFWGLRSTRNSPGRRGGRSITSPRAASMPAGSGRTGRTGGSRSCTRTTTTGRTTCGV